MLLTSEKYGTMARRGEKGQARNGAQGAWTRCNHTLDCLSTGCHFQRDGLVWSSLMIKSCTERSRMTAPEIMLHQLFFKDVESVVAPVT